MNPDSQNPARRAVGSWTQVGDALLACVLLTLIVLEIWVLDGHDLELAKQVGATVLAPIVALPLAIRSDRPMAAFLINSAATVTMVGIGYSSDFYQWANLLLLFNVAVLTRGRDPWLALAIGLAGVSYYFVAFSYEGLDSAVMILALWLVVWLIGRVYSARSDQHRLRTERDLVAELAATRQARLDLEAQRTTMARELHDLIGHTVNVMVVHAGAGRRAVRTDPDGAEQAFSTIETTGRSALDELDRVLGVLRNDDPGAPLAPLPGLDAVPELVDEFSKAGLPTELLVDGPTEAVPDGVGLTVYRVVQEALTNTIKHADASRAQVEISVIDGDARVVVTDDGHGGGGGTGGTGDAPGLRPDADAGVDGGQANGGRGLRGIAERVQLHGGTARFGPLAEADTRGSASLGFRVECRIPLIRAEAPL